MNEPKPIAFDAYEKLAESYAQLAPDKAENGYIEHPAMRAQLGDVSGLQVLDAGCGPGLLTAWLVDRGAAVTGVDMSPKMLALAEARLQGRAALHRADLAQAMPFLKDASFDLVASSLAMDYILDWSMPLAEFRRVLRPNGRLVFTVQHPVGAYLWYKLNRYTGVQYAESTWKGFGGEAVTMPDFYRSFAEMMSSLISAGFRVTHVADTLPVPALKAKDAALFEKYSRRPPFMLLEAVS